MTKIFNEETEVLGTVDVGAEVAVHAGTEKLGTVDVTQIGLLTELLTVLQKIEYHLFLGTDIELKDQDVGG